MKQLLGLLVILAFIIACNGSIKETEAGQNLPLKTGPDHDATTELQINADSQLLEKNKQAENKVKLIPPAEFKRDTDSMFSLQISKKENLVSIKPPKKIKFELPDSTAETKVIKYGDFNADGKRDLLVNLGACGTGGCMAGLFLKQYDSYYKLVFLDYLKGPQFEVAKNGFWIIKSYEEIQAYNPSKLQVSVFKFDKKRYEYKLDTTFIYYNN